MEIRSLIAERLGGVSFGEEQEIYKFEKIKRAKREAIKKHPEMQLIDLGVGEPDRAADEQVIEVLRKLTLTRYRYVIEQIIMHRLKLFKN